MSGDRVWQAGGLPRTKPDRRQRGAAKDWLLLRAEAPVSIAILAVTGVRHGEEIQKHQGEQS
jgi:hypothetical protein